MTSFNYAYSGSGTYVPSLEATGNLIVNFSRNPDKFPLMKYIGLRKVPKDTGFYIQIKSEETARLVSMDDWAWPDGNMAPTGVINTEAHQFPNYVCQRYAYPFTLGYKAVQQAAWQIVAMHAGIQASRAMLARTFRVQQVLQTAGNWAGNTATATALGGGLWSAATTANLYIKKSLETASQNIQIATNGVVQPKDLQLIVNPNLASVLSQTDEIHNYMKGSSWSYPYLQMTEQIGRWGLPPDLYGIKVVIEDTVRISSRKAAATLSRAYVMPNNIALLMARPESLSGDWGGASFNTFTLFAYEEFMVETRDDPDNRLTRGRVVEDTAEVLTAPASGYLITTAQ